MKKTSLALLTIYKKIFSRVLFLLLGSGCRYDPTCSEYSKEAIGKYGVINGGKLTIKRVSRCHPLSKRGSFDPVP